MFYSNLKFENPQTGESKTFAIAVNQTGEGAPHGGTPGNPGMLYMNTVNGDLYKCSSVKQETGVHVWEKVWSSSWNAKEADPTVFDWAKKEMFNKNGFTDPANRNSFILIDGVEYYRYSATAQSFEYHNPYPYPGSVQITMRVSPQYENATGSKIIAEYSDGTSELIGTATGETFVFTTPADKTLSYIRGNYDKENWQLIDMSVMSMVAMYNIGLPIADVNAAGGVKADPAESTDTQPVRIGADGKLYTAPGASGGGVTPVSGGDLELIATVTTTEEVTVIEIDMDSNGEQFSLKDVGIKVSSSVAPGNMKIEGARPDGTYFRLAYIASTNKKAQYFRKFYSESFVVYMFGTASDVTSEVSWKGFMNAANTFVTNIKLELTTSDKVFAVGTNVELWGVRA